MCSSDLLFIEVERVEINLLTPLFGQIRNLEYRRGEDQLLHKQYVTTGVVQWGYTEIKSGLTADDWIAFPYGKDVKENAETIESDNSDDFYYYGSY